MGKNELKPWMALVIIIMLGMLTLYLMPYKESIECVEGKCVTRSHYILRTEDNAFTQDDEIYIEKVWAANNRYYDHSYIISGSNLLYRRYDEALKVLNKIKTEPNCSIVQYNLPILGCILVFISAILGVIVNNRY